MNKLTASALIAILTLTACKDDMQAQLEQQQKQIEALQQQLEQQADDTVYQLAPNAVKETIPADALANGNNGQPVAGKDGQQYIYDQSTGSWLLQSLVGAAAGAFIGNALSSKFMQAGNQNSPVARTPQCTHQQGFEHAQPTGKTTGGATAALPSDNTPSRQLPSSGHARFRQEEVNPLPQCRLKGFRRHFCIVFAVFCR